MTFEPHPARKQRHNQIQPELLRLVRRTAEEDRPRCPTCGQVPDKGDGAFLLKWNHRGLDGEPCFGWGDEATVKREIAQ